MITTLSDALAERGFDTLTAVQTAVTAPELAEADLLVSAQTGSGKTVGFGLAIAPTLLDADGRFGPPAAPLALVVAPTRELALQVQRELAWLYGKAGARVVSCIGGMDARDERRALDRGAHIVVGTPGRLRDHITRKVLDLADIRAVVLDEADEMLDLGFREDLEFMLAEAPATRRTLLFSATVSPSIAELAKTYQRDAVRVTTLTGATQHADIAYQAVQVAEADAEHAIINLLRFHDAAAALVFANTRATVARLTARFANRGLAVVSLSGELSQDERSHALQALRDGRARVCVATDVAARGIDLPNLELVIHADLPTNTEALLHRSGRTGRAGRKGISAIIVPDKMSKRAARLLKWAKIEAEWIFAPSAEEILARDEERLLADPAWDAVPTDAETAFAATLLAQHAPERIAAACLRLYRARLSAPEDLNVYEPRAAREDRAPFGPSAWVSLSVGRDQRAEPRWLLPLLCRTANLEKAQIGKIRVQAEETFVELAAAALPGVLDNLGADGVLEDGIRLRPVDGVPDLASQPRPERAPRADRPKGKRPRADAPPARNDAVPHQGASAPAATRPAAPKRPAQAADAPAARTESGPVGRPDRRPEPGPDAPKPARKPRAAKSDEKPRKPQSEPRKGNTGDRPAKPRGAKFGKPEKTGKPARALAADPSQRLSRPDGKPSGRPGKPKPRRHGGDAPPRRKG
ncbi:MAG: DEAD/DEAH box helicase [Rhodobacteraceae bacterium]|nr:DEAD/DEAH box helicase [Paracoccaceae bacterium]